MGITAFKFVIWGGKLSCLRLQIKVLRLRWHVAVKQNFRPLNLRFTFPDDKFECSYPLNVLNTVTFSESIFVPHKWHLFTKLFTFSGLHPWLMYLSHVSCYFLLTELCKGFMAQKADKMYNSLQLLYNKLHGTVTSTARNQIKSLELDPTSWKDEEITRYGEYEQDTALQERLVDRGRKMLKLYELFKE